MIADFQLLVTSSLDHEGLVEMRTQHIVLGTASVSLQRKQDILIHDSVQTICWVYQVDCDSA